MIAAKADDVNGDALFDWLNENKFDQPEESRPIIARYVRLKHYFVTLKLINGKDAGDLVPIVLKYKAPLGDLDISCIPLRLTKVAATDSMPVFAWIAGASRAVPQNFAHLEPNFADMPWHKCVEGTGSWGFFGGPVSFNPFGGSNT